MFRGKNYKESAKLIDKQALYDPMEAFGLVIKASKAKFDETVELHVKLGVDGRHADQQVRGAIVLPNGTGKTVRVLVFCKEERKEEALAAGADYAGGMDLVEKIQKENWFEFDTVIASPDMMGTVGRLSVAENAAPHGVGVGTQIAPCGNQHGKDPKLLTFQQDRLLLLHFLHPCSPRFKI